MVLRILNQLLHPAWRQKCICKKWRKANGSYIPKELNSTAITQFRPIFLLNFQGKILFSVIASRVLYGE